MMFDKDEQVERYRRDGYLIVPELMPRAEAAAFDKRMRDCLEGRTPVPWITPESEREGADVETTFVREFNLHYDDDVQLDYLRDRRVKDLLERLVGSPMVGIQSMYFYKPPGMPGQGFHQDSNYIPNEPESLIGCWIALRPATVANGCLWAVPGSHTGPILETQPVADAEEYEHWTREMIGADLSGEVPIELEPGDALFFHGRLHHGSRRNRTDDQWRTAYVCHYVAEQTQLLNRPDLARRIAL